MDRRTWSEILCTRGAFFLFLTVLVQATTVAGVRITDRTVLIMDEVDGMSSGDRGGVGALNALIRKTRVRW